MGSRPAHPELDSRSPETTQAIDAVLKLSAELGAFVACNGIPGDGVADRAEYAAVAIDIATNALEHTGIPTVGRRVVTRAYNESDASLCFAQKSSISCVSRRVGERDHVRSECARELHAHMTERRSEGLVRIAFKRAFADGTLLRIHDDSNGRPK